MKAILIPVKESSRAKQRLAPLLDRGRRADLAWAMFEDVTEAVSQWREKSSPGLVKIVVVTSYDKAAAHAGRLGWDVLREAEQRSESASVDWASRLLRQQGIVAVLRLPADIPLVQPADIEILLQHAPEQTAAVLVPSHDGSGTNAMWRRPPDAFTSRFGPNSFFLHQEEARDAGVPCKIIEMPRIALDVDEPGDLVRLLAHNADTRTHWLLQGWNLQKRLASLERN